MKIIRTLRDEKNLTQEELSLLLHVSRSTVAMWETGEAMPRADKLPSIAKVLGCTVNDLFDGYQPADPSTDDPLSQS